MRRWNAKAFCLWQKEEREMGGFVEWLEGSTARLFPSGLFPEPATSNRRSVPVTLGAALSVLVLFLAFKPAGATDCNSAPAPNLDWRQCSKKSVMLQESNLQGANLSEADFSATNLGGANLASANFEKSNLQRTWFNGAKATMANFARVEGYRSSFEGTSAQGANFTSAELQRANFQNAQLKGANFEKAELGRANFSHAVLTATRFTLANLSRADFTNASFTGPIDFDRAFMYLTRIEGLDLSAATGLQQSQIELACGDAATKLPPGLTRPSGWPCPPDAPD
jgi:uncharacterized protein YjbI with pentapeptide repeats